jgi:hypothetical protein
MQNLKLKNLTILLSSQLKSFILHLNKPSEILDLLILHTNTDEIETTLSLMPNLRSLHLALINVDLDFNLIFKKLRALSSLRLSFDDRYSFAKTLE